MIGFEAWFIQGHIRQCSTVMITGNLQRVWRHFTKGMTEEKDCTDARGPRGVSSDITQGKKLHIYCAWLWGRNIAKGLHTLTKQASDPG